MEKEVVIYALIDPVTCKVRYIGRTTCSLKKRLGEHLSKAKYHHCKTHKGAWIRSLLKINSKPYIRKLTSVVGWAPSHELERELIYKYKDRLVNHDDRGEGGANRTYTEEQKTNLSEKLKEYFKGHKAKTNTPVFAYGYDGVFLSEHYSVKECAEATGVPHSTINKIINGVTKDPSRTKMQFSKVKVASMPNLVRIVKKTPSTAETL